MSHHEPTALADRDPSDLGVTRPDVIAAALASRRPPSTSASASTSSTCRHGNTSKRTASGEPLCVACWRAEDRQRDPRPGHRPDTHHNQEAATNP